MRIEKEVSLKQKKSRRVGWNFLYLIDSNSVKIKLPLQKALRHTSKIWIEHNFENLISWGPLFSNNFRCLYSAESRYHEPNPIQRHQDMQYSCKYYKLIKLQCFLEMRTEINANSDNFRRIN